jgi:hypothetical protein
MICAQIMAEKLANALERGWHFRRAGHSTVRRIMESGAKGCQVVIAGKLTGQRHRTEKFKAGHIKFCGQAKLDWMQQGFSVAKLKPGIMGITVQIMDPEAKLPDEIEIFAPPEEAVPATETPTETADDKEKVEEKKADEALEALKKTSGAAPTGTTAEGAPKPRKPRKKKQPEAGAAEGADAAAPGAEKKAPRKRKKKDEAPKAEEAIVPAPTQAIEAPEKQPLAEKPPEKKEEPKPEEKPAEAGEPPKEA